MLNDPMHRAGDGMWRATAMLAVCVRLALTVHSGLYMHSDWLSDKPEKHGLDARVLADVLEEGGRESPAFAACWWFATGYWSVSVTTVARHRTSFNHSIQLPRA
jgi:hypothetical protein